jgi:nicotinamidase-related amidase
MAWPKVVILQEELADPLASGPCGARGLLDRPGAPRPDEDSWGARIVDDLSPQAGDIVIEGKRGLDTFASTNLDFILRSKGITTLVLGGFLTNCCVESTMRTGYEHGYKVITLNDCLAATSPEEHDNALSYDFPMFSEPMSSDDFIEQLA